MWQTFEFRDVKAFNSRFNNHAVCIVVLARFSKLGAGPLSNHIEENVNMAK